MISLIFILFGITLYGGGKFQEFNRNYISPNCTNAIKGVLACIILLSHMRGYVTLSDNFYDRWFSNIIMCIGQLMVAPYLFYSGYGILESVSKKSNYMQTYPKNRILKTLLHFDIAVLVYIIIMNLIGQYYSASSYLTCWIGWSSVGNSNWFIFDILILYILFYCSHRLFECYCPAKLSTRQSQVKLLLLMSTLSVGLWLMLFFANKGSWWFDTLMAFPLGMWYSYFKQGAEKVLQKPFLSILLMLVSIIVFVLWKKHYGNDILGITSCMFCLLLVLICTKYEFNNKCLQWLGIHAFSIYIIQRLPMNLFAC